MLSIVGFDGGFSEAQTHDCVNQSPSAVPHHRQVRRQRSLLSESISSQAQSMSLLSRAPSCESMGSGELSSSFSEATSTSPGADSQQSSAESSTSTGATPIAGCGGININYDRAARARIDRAEAQGRRRDEQLEMLHAVRQYMATTKALGKAMQSSSSGRTLPPSC